MDNFDFKSLKDYSAKYFKSIKVKGVYAALLLFFAYKNKATPKWAKNIIIGALGYFLSPIDGIPDLSPFIGFTDDIGIMMFGLVTIACYIDEEIREKAKSALYRYFPNPDLQDLVEVDRLL